MENNARITIDYSRYLALIEIENNINKDKVLIVTRDYANNRIITNYYTENEIIVSLTNEVNQLESYKSECIMLRELNMYNH